MALSKVTDIKIFPSPLSPSSLGPKAAGKKDSGTGFLAVLRDKFDEVTANLQQVPGMNGVYTSSCPAITPLDPTSTKTSSVV